MEQYYKNTFATLDPDFDKRYHQPDFKEMNPLLKEAYEGVLADPQNIEGNIVDVNLGEGLQDAFGLNVYRKEKVQNETADTLAHESADLLHSNPGSKDSDYTIKRRENANNLISDLTSSQLDTLKTNLSGQSVTKSEGDTLKVFQEAIKIKNEN